MNDKRTARASEDFSSRLALARQGSTAALWQLIADNRAYLLALATDLLPTPFQSKAEGADLVGAVILVAFKGFKDFRGQSAEEWAGWLGKLLTNLVLALVRAYRTQKRDIRREVSLHYFEGDRTIVLLSGPGPDTELYVAEIGLALEAAVAGLSPRSEQVFRLRFCDNLSYRDIGSRLGVSEKAAQKVGARARRSVAHRLQRQGFLDE